MDQGHHTWYLVSPSPFGLDFGTLEFGTSDSGLTIEILAWRPGRVTPTSSPACSPLAGIVGAHSHQNCLLWCSITFSLTDLSWKTNLEKIGKLQLSIAKQPLSNEKVLFI